MFIYSFTIVLLILLVSLECLNTGGIVLTISNKSIMSDRNKKVLYFTLWLFLFFVSAFRAPSVGTDMARYVSRYYIIASTPLTDLNELPHDWGFEYGFLLFCKLISFINSNNYLTFTILTSIIVSVGFSVFIYNYCKLPFFSSLIFVAYGYWNNSFNTVRQYMSISLVLLGFHYYQKRKIILAIVLNIIALSFHYSAVVFIVIYFLNHFDANNKRIAISIASIATIVVITPTSIINKALSYTSYGWYVDRSGSGTTTLIVLIILFLISFYYASDLFKLDDNFNIWFWLLGLGIIANTLALNIGLFERIMRYYLVSLFPLGSDVLSLRIEKGNYHLVYFISILLICLYYYLIILVSPEASSNTVPYYSYFSR